MTLIRLRKVLMVIASGGLVFQATTSCDATTLLESLNTIAKLAVVYALSTGIG